MNPSMYNQPFFSFKSNISKIIIPSKINNPFVLEIVEISQIAAQEFQEFMISEAHNWGYDFNVRQGKMFGVLVVQREDGVVGFLGAVSGKLPGSESSGRFVPSVFDESIDNYFFSKGMTELTVIGGQIGMAKNSVEVKALTEKRSQKSKDLQKWLFENYNFLNLSGEEKNLLEIFKDSSHGKPPSAAGECAAPKLLQYAIANNLKPIAIAEFWWGNPIKNNDRVHKVFYPSCKDKCRPILEYMLEDKELYGLTDTTN